MTRNRRDRRDRLKEFFEDSHGYYSMTRLVFLLTNLASLFISVFCTVKGAPNEAIGLVGALGGVSFVGKVAQKQIEEQQPPSDSVE